MSLVIANVTAPTDPGMANKIVLPFIPAVARDAIARVPISSV